MKLNRFVWITSFCLAGCLIGIAALADDASKAPPCFDGTLDFFQSVGRAGNSADDRLQIINNSCTELAQKEMFEGKSVPEQGLEMVSQIGAGIFGNAVGAFQKMQASDAQKAYMAKLEAIKKIPDPLLRIRSVYALVAVAQGHYDYSETLIKSFGKIVLHNIFTASAETLIDRSEAEKTVGVCREMASLLAWSLLQVSRAPDSASPQLGPNDFSAELVFGKIPGASGWGDGFHHYWVRVQIPNYKNGQLEGFNRFDLDTTFYPEMFSPLMPRRSALSEENRVRAVTGCDQIKKCLMRQAVNASAAVAAPDPSIRRSQ